MISFASDNNSGVHPKVLEAIARANAGHAPAYGNDGHTARAVALLRSTFGDDTRAFFVFLGTAANTLAIAASLKPHEAVVCADSAHIHTDECGALEAAGRKLYVLPGRNGKIAPEDIEPLLFFAGDVHHSWPKMVSITQSTELGSLYRPDEVRALAAFCRANGLYLHMDGARLANAAAALGLGLREASRDLGVDVLSLGGTKNGLMYGEAVLFFNPDPGRDFPFYRKQHLQLGAKMRYIAAQFEAYLTGGLWLENAQKANAASALLAAELQKLPGVELARPCEVNGIFALIPRPAFEKLNSRFPVSIWSERAPASPERPEVRIMTSFDTTGQNVLDFVTALREILE
jgi:threonine aldolase